MKFFNKIALHFFRLSPLFFRRMLRDNLPLDLVNRIVNIIGKDNLQKYHNNYLAKKLEQKLWAGFSEYALTDLENLKSFPHSSKHNIAHAAWALGRWYFASGEMERAYENFHFSLQVNKRWRGPLGPQLLAAECLTRLGRGKEARDFLKGIIPRRVVDSNHLLFLANTYSGVECGHGAGDLKRLELLNQVFTTAGLIPLQLADPAKFLRIDNLSVTDEAYAGPLPLHQPLVSVLMPAHNAETTLHVALNSLRRQTWRALEILVIDDASTDGTADVVRRYNDMDSRIRLIQQERNNGAYAARNIGLALAKGEFVTTHDADDWSHPQKIEIQVRQLLKESETVGNTTFCVRVFPHMFFCGPFRPTGKLIQLNHSSLLLRRQTLLNLGGWDEVRIAADSECIRRIEAFGQGRKTRQLLPAVPLSFALIDSNSLTRRSLTHTRTLFYGVRREYHESSNHWLANNGTSQGFKITNCNNGRSFPAPAFILPERSIAQKFDLLFVMDFNLGGGAYVSTMNYVGSAIESGRKVAIFHWRRYDTDVAAPLRWELRDLAQQGRLYIVSPGEKLHADLVIVGYPVILQYAVDLPPDISCKRFLILTNQMAARLYSGEDVQYDPQVVSGNVRRLFGLTPTWVPISKLVRGLMQQDRRYEPIAAATWTPLIDVTTWCSGTNRRWRRRTRPKPVVGRHARDHYTKWPSDARTIEQAYCAGKSCDVFLLGGAEKAVEVLGYKPGNWTIHPFGSLSPREFLDGLDFFIHYPHEEYIEEFGRSIIEAMAVGIPVILPAVFQQNFAASALYAAPEDLWEVLEELWCDETAYLARVAAGREFVHQHSSWSEFARRLEAIDA